MTMSRCEQYSSNALFHWLNESGLFFSCRTKSETREQKRQQYTHTHTCIDLVTAINSIKFHTHVGECVCHVFSTRRLGTWKFHLVFISFAYRIWSEVGFTSLRVHLMHHKMTNFAFEGLIACVHLNYCAQRRASRRMYGQTLLTE